MQLTGHKTEAVYRRYAVVSESDLGDGQRSSAPSPGTKAGTNNSGARVKQFEKA